MPRCSTLLGALAAIGMVVCGCSSGSRPTSSVANSTSGPRRSAVSAATAPGPDTAAAEGATPADTDAAGIEWLCRPGQADDPCVSDLTATAVLASGASRVERASVAAHPPVDCFYVYPTVSGQ